MYGSKKRVIGSVKKRIRKLLREMQHYQFNPKRVFESEPTPCRLYFTIDWYLSDKLPSFVMDLVQLYVYLERLKVVATLLNLENEQELIAEIKREYNRVIYFIRSLIEHMLTKY